MRLTAFLMLLAGIGCFTAPAASIAQDKGEKRFGLAFEPDLYPQATPKELLASVLKAVKRERYDYLVAQLMEPKFVDNRLKTSRLTPEQMAKEVQSKFGDQPEVVKDLLRLLSEGEVVDGGEKATIKHKDIKNQQLFLKKLGDRWFIENRMKEEKE